MSAESSLNPSIELSTVLTLQILELFNKARVERETALATLKAVTAHVEQLRGFTRV